MREAQLAQAVSDAAADVLEKMFFISPDETEELQPAPAGPVIAVQLSFEGEPSGMLTLRVPQAVARSMAADFLAEDQEQLSEEQVAAVACELANMICGSVLSRIDTNTTFRLAHPRVLEDAADLDSCGAVTHTIPVEAGSLVVLLKVEEPCSTATKSES